MSTIIQLDLASILEKRIAIYIVLGVLFAAAALVLYLQSRRIGHAVSRTIAHLECVRADLRSINETNTKILTLLGFTASYAEDQVKTEAHLAKLQIVCAQTNDAIQTVSSATVENLSSFLQKQDAAKRDAEREAAQREQATRETEQFHGRLIAIERARKRYEVLAESKVCRISTLVADISKALAAQSALTNGCEKAVRPYLDMDSKVKDVAGKIEQLNPAIEDANETVHGLLESLSQAVENLNDRHRPAWCVGLLDLARKSLPTETQSKDLTNLLGLEEVQVTPGTDLNDYNSLCPEIVESDGDGSKSVITELVEVGYRNKETGTVLKPPKVKVRFEE